MRSDPSLNNHFKQQLQTTTSNNHFYNHICYNYSAAPMRSTDMQANLTLSNHRKQQLSATTFTTTITPTTWHFPVLYPNMHNNGCLVNILLNAGTCCLFICLAAGKWCVGQLAWYYQINLDTDIGIVLTTPGRVELKCENSREEPLVKQIRPTVYFN